MEKKYHLTLIMFLLCFASFGQINTDSEPRKKYKLIEKFTELSGFQYLSQDSSFFLPLTKIGYSVFLPNDEVIGSITFPCMLYDSTKWNNVYNIIEPAINDNLAVIMLNTGRSIEFLFNDKESTIIDSLLNEALISCELKDKPTIFAGISLGGTVVMKYAEYCLSGKSEFGIKPNGLALVDSPLDFVRWWYSCKNDIRKNYNRAAVFEAKWTLYYLEKHLEGTPETAFNNYVEYSPYVSTDTVKSKLSLYKDMPVIAISEPDILWWMEERGKDYYDINTFDLAAFINDLRIRGNKEARLVITSGKGYRENGMRHPHSWSIVDIEELMKWSIEIVVKQE